MIVGQDIKVSRPIGYNGAIENEGAIGRIVWWLTAGSGNSAGVFAIVEIEDTDAAGVHEYVQVPLRFLKRNGPMSESLTPNWPTGGG